MLLLAAGCASGGGGATTDGADLGAAAADIPAGRSIIQVVNDTRPGVYTVWMVPDGGIDQLLGTTTIRGGEPTAFPFDGAPGRYTLRVFGPPCASPCESRAFQFYRNSLVRWDMNLSQVRVSGRR
jgi:hypothetical protein